MNTTLSYEVLKNCRHKLFCRISMRLLTVRLTDALHRRCHSNRSCSVFCHRPLQYFNDQARSISVLDFNYSIKYLTTTGNDDSSRKRSLDYATMPITEKRKYYRCGDRFVTVSNLTPWSKDGLALVKLRRRKSLQLFVSFK